MSDSHSCWDDRFSTYASECDEIWHAGDIGDADLLNRLEDIGKPLRAVSGNIDHGEVKRRCPEIDIFETEGVKVLLTHIGGYPGRWAPGMKKLLKEEGIKLMVDGHSHILKVIYDPELDLLHINPGACGKQGWQKKRTLVMLQLHNGKPSGCEVVELA